jgi:hypothetical protein
LELADDFAVQLGQFLLARDVAEVLAIAGRRERPDAHDFSFFCLLTLVDVRGQRVVESRNGGHVLDDLRGIGHLAKDLVPQTLELGDRRERRGAGNPAQEVCTVLALGRRLVLRRQHRLREHRGGVARDLPRDAEELAKVALALGQERIRLGDALLVVVPLLVERVAARFGSIAALRGLLSQPLLALKRGTETPLALLRELALLISQPLHTLAKLIELDRWLRGGRRRRRRRLCPWRLLPLRERRRARQQRRDGQGRHEAVSILLERAAHDRAPCGAGTGTMMRSGAFSSFAMLSAFSIAARAAGSATHVFCVLSQ